MVSTLTSSFSTIVEGSITMRVPNPKTTTTDDDDDDDKSLSSQDSKKKKKKKMKKQKKKDKKKNPPLVPQTVFYNPVQVQNRDLSILMITLFVERRLKQQLLDQKRNELRQQRLPRKYVDEQVAEYQAMIESNPGKYLQLLLVDDNSNEDNNNAVGDNNETKDASKNENETNNNSNESAFITINPHPFGITIMEALAASGLRSLRYWNEIPGIRHILINDLDSEAIQRAKENLQHNALAHVMVHQQQQQQQTATATDQDVPVTKASSRPPGIQLQCGDATLEMYLSRRDPKLATAAPTAPSSSSSSTTTSPPPPSTATSQFSSLASALIKDQWDVIDLDPYGSAAPFLDSAIQAVADGGMLCVTCTDMAALGGSHPETCYGRYHGSMPITRANYLQEMALRVLLYSMATTAAKYGRTIQPLLSVGMDFYIRTFCLVHDNKAGVQDLSLQIGNVYQSTQCATFITSPHGRCPRRHVYQGHRLPLQGCPETGAALKVGGPIWLGPLHDPEIVAAALQRLEGSSSTASSSTASTGLPHLPWLATRDRLLGLLTNVHEELIDVPLYYTLPDLCHTLHCTSPQLVQVKAALVNAGYRVSGYHKEPQAIKTDAPSHVVWDILRVWCQKHPPKGAKNKDKRKQQKSKHVQPNDNHADTVLTTTTTAAAETTATTDPLDATATQAAATTTPSTSVLLKSISERILSIAPTTNVDFTIPSSLRPKKPTVARFPMNPQPNWGPKPKATGGVKRKKPDGQDDNNDNDNDADDDDDDGDDGARNHETEECEDKMTVENENDSESKNKEPKDVENNSH